MDYDKPRPKRKCVLKKTICVPDSDDELSDDSDFEQDLFQKFNIEDSDTQEIKMKHFVVRLTMQNTMMMFRKIVDHPYLIHFPLDTNAEEKRLLINENLIKSSGKMMVLDLLLQRLKKTGHKVSFLPVFKFLGSR